MICGERPDQLHIDHNHETGEIRGLLCIGCNVLLGRIESDPQRIAKALRYLKGERCGL